MHIYDRRIYYFSISSVHLRFCGFRRGAVVAHKTNIDVKENCSSKVINGCIGGSAREVDSPNGNEMDTQQDVSEDESVLSSKNIIKKKKSKRKRRKTQEHKNAKRLRSEMANDVEVLKFSETNISESF